MRTYKPGGHRLFGYDDETARVVSEMLRDLERDGMDAVRRYSAQFDDWGPASFELSPAQIDQATDAAQGRLVRGVPNQVGAQQPRPAASPTPPTLLTSIIIGHVVSDLQRKGGHLQVPGPDPTGLRRRAPRPSSGLMTEPEPEHRLSTHRFLSAKGMSAFMRRSDTNAPVMGCQL